MGHVRDMLGGKDHDSRFGARMRGTGLYGDMIAQGFSAALRRHGYARSLRDLRCDVFRPPEVAGDRMSLF